MKSAKNQQSRKVAYFGTSSHITYTGTRTQPGYVGNAAGTKLARKSDSDRKSRFRGGIVSRALENIAKGKRVAA